ncbi:MAG: hypothetical protein ABIQ53_15230 [Terracoccus sp.]
MVPARTSSPIPREVSDELGRVVARWHQLPRGRALSGVPAVRELVQSLADEVARCWGDSLAPLPDLGPATLMNQLEVMVFDLFTGQPETNPAVVTEQLSGIRRAL